MRTALLWMPCRPPGAKLILFSACGTLGGGPVALCEPRHTRGNRGLEADLGPASEQISATVRTCQSRCGRLTVRASAGTSARGDVEGRNATVEYRRLAVGAGLSRDRGNGVHCPWRTNLRIYARECVPTRKTRGQRGACRSAHSAAWNGGEERCTIRTKFPAPLRS